MESLHSLVWNPICAALPEIRKYKPQFWLVGNVFSTPLVQACYEDQIQVQVLQHLHKIAPILAIQSKIFANCL